MRKISILILMVLFAFLFTAHATYAALVPEPAEDETGLWHVETLDRVYVYLRYTKSYTVEAGMEYQETNATNHYTYNTMYINGSNAISFFNDETISNPDDTTYNYFRIHSLSGGVETVVFDGIVDDLLLSAGGTVGYVFKLEDQDGRILHEVEQGDSFKAYWYTASVESGATIADLPETTGNMIDAVDDPMGYVTITNINTETRAVDFSILYNEISYEIQMLLEDISFLEEVHHAYYYKYGEEQFFYFSYSDHDLFIEGYNEEKGTDWKGFTVWNLTTDEVSQIRSLYVLTHFIEDENHDVYAYFYTPNVIMDELISVTVSFRYRFEKVFGGYTAWEYPDPIILEKDSASISTTTWETTLYAGSAASAVTLSFLSLAASSLVWPALVVGGLAVGVYAILSPSITGIRIEAISEIERPTLSGAFVQLLEDEWGVTIDSVNNSPHKLYLGQYQKAFTNGIDLEGLANDGDYSYSEIIWRRDTQQYVATFDEIITETATFTLSDNLLPDEPVLTSVGNILQPFLVPGVTIVFALAGAKQLIGGDFKKLGIIAILYVIALIVIVTVL
jgi:hypothetical protein